MCFYNQKVYTCGDRNWGNFAHQCNYEYRTGETCGMKLVSKIESETTKCRLCEKIETKERRIQQEKERMLRWKEEGGTLTASIAKSQKLVAQLEKEVYELQAELRSRRRAAD